MPSYPTPGVYVNELNTFPNSVVAVATAVPAFIGYTAQASYQGKPLRGIPTKVESLAEFEAFFGADCVPVFDLVAVSASMPTLPHQVAASSVELAGQLYALVPDNSSVYYLHRAIQLFYLNGGAACYIVSIRGYDQVASCPADFTVAIDALVNEQEPTLLLCPDAMRLAGPNEYHAVLQRMLAQCAALQSRVVLFDVWAGAVTSVATLNSPANPITEFRSGVGADFLSYGVAYFPWVNASVVRAADLTFRNLTAPALRLLQAAAPVALPLGPGSDARQDQATHQALLAQYPAYGLLLAALAQYLNVLPVAPALAGVYTAVDSSRGVWKAPANVGLNAVESPTVALSDADQAGLTIDAVTGKSINAIRAFAGPGVLVWGARTLDGNSQDWRYVNVRRTAILLEQSVKLALRAYVFAPNDANTWPTIKSLISSFLTGLWQQGALAGARPDEAYSVQAGLGSTMTADDILNGLMRVTVLVALVRPAEFIVLTFQQQMPQP